MYKPPVYLLFSGGIDSTALIHFYQTQKFPVFLYHMDYGQPSMKRELNAVKKISNHFGLRHQQIIVKGLGKISKGEITGRNSLFVFLALTKQKKINSGLIGMAIHNGSLYPDSTKLFVKYMQDVIDLYTDGKMKFSCPFIDWYKEDIILYSMKKKLPLELTYSCELGLEQPCGKCQSCKDLIKLMPHGIFSKKY